MTDRESQLERALADAIGMDAMRAAELHFGEGVAIRQVAEWIGKSPTTTWRHVRAVEALLVTHGLRPAHWKHHPPGRPAKNKKILSGCFIP